ncbi:hypothetical protein [Nocardia seriolae]|uniref:hypothetical protein n=1 Tax=Nocardia seriolae TaxID=37332 RepID=UPI00131A03F5|nr:hypothetical protein [Nocardia seriolae]QOW33871.1 hypothetical protein IMZ23_01520 [Nocardia seriolae]QUN18633.1 hypothetical protein KEC46_04205 [Nocardia seriolae]WNJ61071.1 hypothetical protein RMO66_10435 [Nocardia seriolae]
MGRRSPLTRIASSFPSTPVIFAHADTLESRDRSRYTLLAGSPYGDSTSPG